MGRFSAELSAIMDTRNITLGEVIRAAGVSRAAFFKYRNGSRLPSDIRTVERLAEVLQLNFDERRRFMEGFMIDQIGEYRYRGMMAIEKLLCTPAGFLRAGTGAMTLPAEALDETRSALNGRLSVTVALMSMIGEGLKKGDVTVFETISSDTMFRIIGQVKGSNREHELIHIMAMNGSDNASAEDRLYNVERLGSIITTLCSTEGYRPFYYYASLSTLRTLGTLTTNMILTKDAVLCYAEDYSSAVIYRDPESNALYGNIVSGVRRMARPYAEKRKFMDGVSFERKFYEYPGERYSFFPGLTINAILKESDDILEKNVRHDIEGIDMFMAGYQQYADAVQASLAANKGRHHYIISGPGIRFNYANGVVNDFPKEAIIPLDREGSRKLMRRFRRVSELYDFRVLDDERFPGDNTIGLEAVPGQAMLCIFASGELATHVIEVREQATAALLYDYLSSLYENRAITGKEREAWYDEVLAENKKGK